ANERMEVMLKSLGEIYPKVDIRKHIIGNPVTVSWENEPYFMGAFKANLPGHYRYQRRLCTHFMQDRLPEDKRGIFLAGDDISWTAGWAEGAVQTALNAVWCVRHHLAGRSDPTNPGPGARYAEIAPVDLPEDGAALPGRPDLPSGRPGSGVSSMRPAKPTAVSSRAVRSPATSGSPRSAHRARAAVQAASRARSRLQAPSRWVSGSAISSRSGPGISSSRIRSSNETRRSPTRSKSSSRRAGSQPRVRQVSTTASARSWPMCALMPASANCSGRTPG